VQLQDKVNEKLGGLVAIDASSPYAATGVWIQGRLVFRQNFPLRQSQEERSVYAENPLAAPWSSNWVTENQPLTVQALLGRYARRNETVHLEYVVPPVWDYTPRDSFKVHVTIDVPPQLIYYVPGAAEVLKFAWVQLVAFLIPTWLIIECLKGLAFDYQLVETYVVSQLPQKDA